MKNIDEDLKTLRESDGKPAPSLQDLEGIARKISTLEYNRGVKLKSFTTRLLPECYSTFTFNNLDTKNFHEESLFFIFYALPESELQLNAYNELINKGYSYSKAMNAFVFCGDTKAADNKKRSILVFDPFRWEKVHREVLFDDAFVEGLEHRVECRYMDE